ncbi:MAG TPA: radical SAM protein [Candidatus Acidoferrum sp.]
MQTATYGDFSSLLHDRQQGRRAPMEVSIELTHRCPLECQHCYNNLPMSDVDARKRELTFDEHVRLLDELVEMGCLWILYTGGEVFARKDFLDIYTEAKKRGFLVTIFTNGTMITPRIADYLAEYRPFAIEITLYGATRETYETLTQIPGSFDRCMKGIHLLKERNLPLKLKTVPTTINFHEVYEMKRFAEQDLGVEFKFDPLVNPRTDCSQSPLAVRLSPEEVVSIDFRDPVRKAEFKKMAVEELAGATRSEGPQKYTCGGGQNGCAIDPQGKMTICVLSHQDGADLRDGGFKQGWDGRLKDIRQSTRTRKTICSTCQLQSLCSMCPANGELEGGDAETPVEFLCQVAHLRAYTLGLEVPEHGDCPCCFGGAHHQHLTNSAQRLQKETLSSENIIPLLSLNSILPVLSSPKGCGSGGCTSCGSHTR